MDPASSVDNDDEGSCPSTPTRSSRQSLLRQQQQSAAEEDFRRRRRKALRDRRSTLQMARREYHSATR